MKIILLHHLRIQAVEREIDLKFIKDTLSSPGQIVPDAKGLKIAQKKYFDKKIRKEYLIRVIFREEITKRIGITVYMTSKIQKYWRQNENKI